MNNVLLDKLPTEWNGYKINTDFQVGIQLQLMLEDETLNDIDKYNIQLELLFGEPDGSIREHPTGKELNECVGWFLQGWFHDNALKESGNNKKIVDYDIDQYRIYADFLREYHIDLATTYIHWWKFCGLLWNLPSEQSAFHNAIKIRKEVIRHNMSNEQKQNILKQKQIYELRNNAKEITLTNEQKDNMNDFYKMLEE